MHDARTRRQATPRLSRGRRTVSAPRWTGRRSSSTSPRPPSGPSYRVEQIHTEYGHDQTRGVAGAGHSGRRGRRRRSLTRIVLGRVAARHGLRISFSPVPFEGEAGNGAHLHMSLADDDGPLFSGGDGPHGMRRGRRVRDRRGARTTLPDLLGVYAGSRAVGGCGSNPATGQARRQCWGLENREAAVRFVAATPGQPARRQRRAQADRSERQPLPRGGVASRQRTARHRAGARPARRDSRRTRRRPRTPPTMLPTDQRVGDQGPRDVAGRRANC